jgi:uncharacterized membrane protein (TIGR02234 family)
MSARRIKTVVIVCGLAFSAVTLIAWTQDWFSLTLTGSSSSQHTIAVGGDSAAPAVMALSLSGLALVAALSLAGPFFRRVLGVLETLIGLSVVLAAVQALTDPIAASAELITKATGVSGAESIRDLVTATAQTPWPWVALVFGVLIACLGVALLALGRRWPVSSTRFQSTQDEPDAAEPTSASDWDSLTGGADPTSR